MSRVMIKKVWLCGFCLSLLAVGCTGTNSTSSKVNQDNRTGALKEVTTFNTNDENELLRARIEQVSRAAQGRIGVTATVLETGESASLNGEQRFPMQSVYKFPIAMAVLAQVDQGKLKLDQKIRVEASDIVQQSHTKKH